MCGIVGFISKNSDFLDQAEKKILNACKKMKSRGPDDTGIFINQKIGIGLGQTRLKIQDLSDQANQPLFSNDKSLVLLFNGQLYNHWQIRSELTDYNFKSTSDTETFLAAYQFWGIKAFDKMEGMFAASIFDFKNQKMLILRDRFGIKPLYFFFAQNSFGFSSQLNSLIELINYTPDHSELALYHFQEIMATPAPLTKFKNIFKIPAGFFMEINKNDLLNPKIQRWYHLSKKILLASKEESSINDIFQSLQLSVKRHILASDVPVGLFLSGGVDSSLIAGLSGKQKIHQAFHLHFQEHNQIHEEVYAKLVAKQKNIPLQIIPINENIFNQMTQKILLELDDLIADPVVISFAFLAQAAKQAGLKVVLVGEGADEIFWGYPHYFKHFYLERFVKNFIKLIPLSNKIVKNFLSPSKINILKRIKLNKFSFLSGAILHSENNKIIPENENNSNQINWIKKFFGETDIFDPLDYSSWHQDSFFKKLRTDQKISYLEFCHRLPELLLMRCDKIGMMFGIETRVPFLDHNLVEMVLQAPINIRSNSNEPKFLLRTFFKEIFGFIPEHKIGFAAPYLQKNGADFWRNMLIKTNF